MATELGDYLRSRRAQAPAAELGVFEGGRKRRVQGLRREELAELAGVSVDYITRLEQGRVKTASLTVLNALARALRLRPDEHEYLLRCAEEGRAASPRATRPHSGFRQQRVLPATQLLLDSMTGVPAVVLGRRMDVLAWNALGAALITDFSRFSGGQRNLIWLTFLDLQVRARYQDWEAVARDCVAFLRMDASRYPDDARLASLVGELSVKDEDFGRWWADHRVRAQQVGRKRFLHPVAGPLTLNFQTLDVRGAANQTILVYTTEPGSPSAEALTFLDGWTSSDTATSSVRPT
ncbi:transcriptional regulator [Streptomyces sp. WAC 01325]|uniref:helix-turn-helix domain-containing protein n=1 Tax=Streptomyces sp. WAC 01325 TaxID=2203202 RepID=UPI000F8954A6|nr:helix-turn-helix transcriptional regulator [Streptomyces sp. WAC 01325]RSM87202.1 transcriptional regulator [Streptomyces sp. WAC 01325]